MPENLFPAQLVRNRQRPVQHIVYKQTGIMDSETIPFHIRRKLCSTQMPNTANPRSRLMCVLDTVNTATGMCQE